MSISLEELHDTFMQGEALLKNADEIIEAGEKARDLLLTQASEIDKSIQEFKDVRNKTLEKLYLTASKWGVKF